MSKTARATLWIWPVCGLLLGGACGWGWRLAGEQSAPEKPALAVLESTKQPAVPTAKVETLETVDDSEAKLKAALDSDSIDDVGRLVSLVAQKHGARALAMVLAWKSSKRDQAITTALYHAAHHDPEGTLKLVLATTELRDRTPRMNRLFEGITRGNVRKAWQLLDTLDEKLQHGAAHGIGMEWARMDWRAAVNHGLGLLNVKQRGRFLDGVVEVVTKQNFGDFAAWMKMQVPATRALLDVKWNNLVLNTPQEFALARDLLPSTADANAKTHLTGELFRVMDATPLTKAWVDALPAGETHDQAWEAYALRASESQPGSLPELLKQAPSPSVSARVTSTIAGLRAYEDPQGALAFAAGLPDARARETARITAMGVIGLLSPPQGMAMVLQNEGEWTTDQMTALRTIYSWTDPMAALEAGLKMKDERHRIEWVGAGVSHWMDGDASAAIAWVSQLPAGNLRDACANRLASRIAQTQPETAMTWARSITDAKKRNDAMSDVAAHWGRQAPDAFSNWLGQAGLDETQAQELRRRAEEMQRLFPSIANTDQNTVIFSR